VWRDLVYLLSVFFPLAIATFVIAVTVWAVSLAFVAMPAYYGSGSGVQFGDGSRFNIDTLPEAIVCSLIGLVLLALVPWILGLLADEEIEVVEGVGDGDALLVAVERHRPDLAIVDVPCRRLTPTRACAPRSKLALASPRRQSSFSRSTSRSGMQAICSQPAGSASAIS